MRNCSQYSRWTVGVLFCVLFAVNSSVFAQGTVNLISPPDEAYLPRGPFTLKWEAYPGAEAYRYSLLDNFGGTIVPPGNGASQNPHLVPNAETEIDLITTVERQYTWFIIAYSDVEGTQEIARSEERVFYTVNITPTPTPTIPSYDIDFTGDGEVNSLDVFYFGAIWEVTRSRPNPSQIHLEIFDDADLDEEQDGIIDPKDLLVLISQFGTRDEQVEPTPTPVLPAPVVLGPVDGTRLTRAQYNTTDEIYSWEAVSGAEDYILELEGPFQRPLRSYLTTDTIYYTENAEAYSGVLEDRDRVTQTGTISWRVRARNASEEQGAWSDLRTILIVPDPGGNPADLTGDRIVNYLDLFKFSRHWQAFLGEHDTYNNLADLDDSESVVHEDLLIFYNEYRAFRSLPPGCQLSAPEILGPEDGRVFTELEVLAGLARIDWEIVSNAESYRITFDTSPAVVFSVQAPPYVFSEDILTDTRITKGAPVEFIIQAICANGEPGAASTPREITILRDEQ